MVLNIDMFLSWVRVNIFVNERAVSKMSHISSISILSSITK